jgi:hypothetical protein
VGCTRPHGRRLHATHLESLAQGLMWNCVVAGMAQTEQVIRVGRRACRCLRSSPVTSVKSAASCAASEPPAAAARAFQIKPLAGAPGFEPGIAGPKPAALPLGYAPPPVILGTATDHSAHSTPGQGFRAQVFRSQLSKGHAPTPHRRDERITNCPQPPRGATSRGAMSRGQTRVNKLQHLVHSALHRPPGLVRAAASSQATPRRHTT